MRSRFLSIRRCSSIFAIECITVVWCFPPNSFPISCRDAAVTCFARYIAICLGKTIARLLVAPRSSVIDRPKYSATADKTRVISASARGALSVCALAMSHRVRLFNRLQNSTITPLWKCMMAPTVWCDQ
jgi:hypothetical protein